MKLFNIFSKRGQDENNNTIPFQFTQDNPESSTEEVINETSPVEGSQKEKPLTVSFSTGWPIDVIYGYLHKNYNQNGYDDAMLNSNLAFRDMNMKIIRNKILMTFREINLCYDSMKNDLDTRMENCNAAGLLTNIAELDKQMSIISAHKSELIKLEEDFRNNANEASVPLMSYECGFLRGISTIAMAGSPRSHNNETTVAPMFSKSSMAV